MCVVTQEPCGAAFGLQMNLHVCFVPTRAIYTDKLLGQGR
jgi:hypothetical protein